MNVVFKIHVGYQLVFDDFLDVRILMSNCIMCSSVLQQRLVKEIRRSIIQRDCSFPFLIYRFNISCFPVDFPGQVMLGR